MTTKARRQTTSRFKDPDVRKLARILRRAFVTPGTVWQVEMEAKATARGEPLRPLPRAFGLGARLPITRESRRGAMDDLLKETHRCTGADLRAAEAVAFASCLPETAGAIMAYRHMREHGRLDVILALKDLGFAAWITNADAGPVTAL